MTEWEPATETEAAMRDALRAGDQELYFRILARTDLLLPVSADALAGRAPMGWGTWTTGGRTHVLAFTSTAALHACLAENAGSTRRAAYPELATGWPNPEWWLAVNPGLPIEGYLPAWFVSQLSRGDVRLPGRSMGARARLEQVERAARARATASVPRRQSDEPLRGEPEPGGPFRPVEPDAAPFRPPDPDGHSFRSGDPDGAPLRPADPDALPVRRPGASREPGGIGESFRRMESDSPGLPFRSTELSRDSAESFRRAESDSSDLPFRPTELSREPVDSFRSAELSRDPVDSFRPTELSREPVESFRSGEPADEPAPAVPLTVDLTPFGSSPEPTSPAPSAGIPATVPVIAPTPVRGGLGGDFGSQISDDTSAGWMTPAGPARSASSSTANGSSTPGGAATAGGAAATAGGASPTSAPPSSSPPSSSPPPTPPPPTSTPPSAERAAGPPPAWYGPAGQPAEQPPTVPIDARTPEDWPTGPGAAETRPAEVTAPVAWTPPPVQPEPSLFTPVSRRPAGESWSDAGERWSATTVGATTDGPTAAFEAPSTGRPATDPVPASRTAADPGQPAEGGTGPTQPIFTGSGLRQALSGRSLARESLSMGSPATERFATATPTEQFSPGPAVSEQFAGFSPTTPAAPPATEPAVNGPPATESAVNGPAVTESAVNGPALTEQFSFGPAATEQFAARPPVTEQFSAGPAVTEQFAASQSAADQFGGGPALTERFPAGPPVAEPPASATAPTEPIPVTGQPAGTHPGTTAPPGAVPRPATDPVPGRRLPSEFVPANDVERSLLDAAGDGSTDTFLSTLLLAKVLLPVAFRSSPGARPGDDGFEWRTELLDGERYVVVFTSPERLGDHLPETVDTIEVKFAQLIRRWPDDNWSFAVNPGTPVGAKLPGGQIVALANWAAEVGLGDDTGEPAPQAPAEEETPRSTYAPAREDPGRPTMMQKTIAPSQLSYYLDRGYDRVSGFVHRASEVAHLRTPAKLYAALGLNHPGSPFGRDAEEIYVLRWPAYRPSLYRIPYGGQNESAMRAMEGWVIERPPFRGNGFAPGESSDVVAEFKVDSVRLPHGAELHRIGVDGSERLVATLDCDVPVWRRAEEG
ncbi:SseB family protein [Plantactinospora endophytica]|uniref:SseB protein N-terminal domain-containing protein n=1 Tax=Plantactinospora endophytica TaxID=673535 RepID=A0ABQ4E8B1_9ACTN|nr:SseB family protein [Plantactinospora endophytica]GIG90948.1 hypothetical protein Pen02_58840 [Plantactinospora endophytica]